MPSVQSRARRLRQAAVLLIAVIALVCFATQAVAKFPPNGLRFFADVGISPPTSRSLITVETIRGSLRVVSIRAVRDVRAAVPTGSAGKTVGRLTLGVRGGAAPSKGLKLVMPSRTSASKLVLARDGQLSVVLRPGSSRRSTGSGGADNLVLSIHGLPTGTTSVSMTFDGAGRGVLGTTHGCPVKPTWKLYAVRDGASPVSVNSRISCGTPLKKRSASGALTENAGTTAASGQPVKLIGTPQVTYSLIADRDRRYLSLAALVRLSSKLTAAEQRSMALLAAPGLRDGQTIRQPAGGFFGGTPLGRIGASGSNCYLAEVVQIRRRSALGVRPWKLGLRPAGAGALMPPVKSIKPRRMSGNWEAAAMRRLGCGATPNSSAAGVAPLLVLNRSGNLNNSPSAHVSFRLPPGAWYASRNDGGEVTRNGTYFRRTPVSGKRCVVSVSVAGRGQLHRPLLTTTNKSDHVRRGTAGAVRWLSARSQLPPTPPLPYAKAYSSAPSWAPWRWSAFSFSAQTEYPATAACRRSMLRVDLAAVARSSRVERGSFTDA